MASTLRAPNLIAIPPLAFARTDESEAMLIYHLGKSLCGHEGIVHGGIVGTILDDSLARNVSRVEKGDIILIGVELRMWRYRIGVPESTKQDRSNSIVEHILPQTNKD
jgi:acyl-coenzyme A thioesterase PaaI-like protein